MAPTESATVRVVLVQLAEQGMKPVAQITSNTVVIGTVRPITGTPGAALPQIFGPQYEAFARASLKTLGFRTVLLGSEEQSLDQPIVEWVWNIMPKQEGSQTFSVVIEVVWKSTIDSARIETESLWTDTKAIQVTAPLISGNVLAFAGLFFGVFGAGLTAPYVVATARERRLPSRTHPAVLQSELQGRYDDLTEQIAAVDEDLSTTLDGERTLVLQRRRSVLVAERERIVEQMTASEARPPGE